MSAYDAPFSAYRSGDVYTVPKVNEYDNALNAAKLEQTKAQTAAYNSLAKQRETKNYTLEGLIKLRNSIRTQSGNIRNNLSIGELGSADKAKAQADLLKADKDLQDVDRMIRELSGLSTQENPLGVTL
jgi:hypothetical protein